MLFLSGDNWWFWGKKYALSMTEHWGELRLEGSAPPTSWWRAGRKQRGPWSEAWRRRVALPQRLPPKTTPGRWRRETSRPAPCHTSKVSLQHRTPCRAPPVVFLSLTWGVGTSANVCFIWEKGRFSRLHGFIVSARRNGTKSLPHPHKMILGDGIFPARPSCQTRLPAVTNPVSGILGVPISGKPSRSWTVTSLDVRCLDSASSWLMSFTKTI